MLLATSIECRLARGELAAAMALADRLDPLLDAPGLTGATAHYARGELSAATGEGERAAGHFLRAGRLVVDDRFDIDDPDLLPWRPAAALAEVRLGRRAQGAALARAHLALSRLAEAPYAVALGLRALAIVDPHGDGIALLREATRRARRHPRGPPDRPDRDRPRRPAAAHRRRGRAGRRRSRCCAAPRSTPAQEELWPLQGRVRRLLDRLGEPARPAPGEVLATLTVSERRIARLAADRPDQPRDRRPARRHGQGRGVAPLARLPQARHPLPDRAGEQPRPQRLTVADPGSQRVRDLVLGQLAPRRSRPPRRSPERCRRSGRSPASRSPRRPGRPAPSTAASG